MLWKPSGIHVDIMPAVLQRKKQDAQTDGNTTLKRLFEITRCSAECLLQGHLCVLSRLSCPFLRIAANTEAANDAKIKRRHGMREMLFSRTGASHYTQTATLDLLRQIQSSSLRTTSHAMVRQVSHVPHGNRLTIG